MNTDLTIPLNGEWSFAYQPEPEKSAGPSETTPTVPPNSDFAVKMPVPGYWDDHMDRVRMIPNWRLTTYYSQACPIVFPGGPGLGDAELPYLIGLGWYRQRFVAPPECLNRTVTLHIGGVALEAWVWLNGQFAGYHLGYSTSFEIALEKYLKVGEENELLIAVANTRTDIDGSAIRGYAGRSGGISRPVSLRIGGAVAVRSLFLYPKPGNQEVVWKLELSGYAGKEPAAWQAEWQIRHPQNGQVLGQGTGEGKGQEGEWTTETFGMQTWSDEFPNLYEIEVRVKQGGVLQDERIQPFGLRRLERDGMLLRLNGTPVYLRGVCESHYFPLTCTAPTSVSFYRHRLRTLRSLGFNWMRFHTWVPNEEYMQAADELGFMMQVEPPFGAGESEWPDILRACRRHPSIVLYCGGNEELLDEANIERLKQMRMVLRELVPEALFSPMQALRGVEYHYELSNLGPDAVPWAPAPEQLVNPRRLRLLHEFSDVYETAFFNMEYGWPKKMIIWLNLTDSWQGNWRNMGELWRWLEDDHPHLLHEHCILGTYLDLDLERRYEGTRIGTDLYAASRRHLEEEGLLPRASLYFQNSGVLVALWRKYHLELTRRCPQAQGYDLLGASDYHWHRTGYPCGVLNEFGEMKPGETQEKMLRYNAASVLLLDHSVRRNFFGGDPFDLELLVSHYGREEVASAAITWNLRDDHGAMQGRGHISAGTIPQGAVTSLGSIQFPMPECEDARKLTLQVRLSGGDLELENQWEFWVFPRLEPIPISVRADSRSLPGLEERYEKLSARSKKPHSPVRIVAGMDEETETFLCEGGRVILLWQGADKSHPEIRHHLRPMSAGRPFGDFATIIADHPLFRNFPHDGYCSWQFYFLLHEANPVIFNDSKLAFDPLLEAVGPYKNVRKQGLLFEYQVGQGRLFVCALTLLWNDPATVFFADTLLAYASGGEFVPLHWATIKEIRRLLHSETINSPAFRNDNFLDPNSLQGRRLAKKGAQSEARI